MKAALRDLRFAVGEDAGPAAKPAAALARPRRPAAQPRRRPARRRGGLLDLARAEPERPRGKPGEQSRAGDPVSAAAKAAAFAFSAFPDAPAAEAEILALWAFDLVTRHPAALAAAAAADRDENS